MAGSQFSPPPERPTLTARCCIAGGGPAGMMLGLLLARAGIDTVVLEKHSDFLRDFRGDTVHPSTLEVMDELGLIDGFLRRPHQQLRQIDAVFGTTPVRIADFTRLGLNTLSSPSCRSGISSLALPRPPAAIRRSGC